MIKIISGLVLPNTSTKVAPKAAIMKTADMNKVAKALNILRCKWEVKSFSSKGEVKMDKNNNKEVADVNMDNASDSANKLNIMSPANIGVPSLSSFPPGTVIAAAKVIVVNSVAVTSPEFAVSFNHFSPCLANSLCSLENTISAVSPTLFFSSMHRGNKRFAN